MGIAMVLTNGHGITFARRSLMRLMAFLLTVTTLLVAAPEPAQAATVTVCLEGCDYSSPDDAANDPARNPGDVIMISSGLYYITSALELDYDVTIVGSSSADTIIDASEAESRAVTIRDGATADVSGVRIQGGAPEESQGGGVSLILGSTATFTDVWVVSNEADSGGGINNSGSTLTMVDSVVDSNTASYEGGGIYTHAEGSTSIVSSIVSSNNATDGAGLAVVGASLEVVDSRINANNASGDGGGILNTSGLLNVESSSITNNTASSGLGGGIASAGVEIYPETTVINSTLAANEAETGGGLGNDGGSSSVDFSTIADNEAGSGGGIANVVGAVELARSIVATNYGATLVDCSGTVLSGGYNLVGEAECGIYAGIGDLFGSSGSPVDPLLSVVGEYGGLTLTMALQESSPAIDAAGGCEALDQRGVARPQGSACDIGAYEAEEEAEATIQAQLDAAGPGGNVVLPAGDYFEDGIVIGDGQTLAGDGLVTISGADGEGGSIIVGGAGAFTLENLTIADGQASSGGGVRLAGTGNDATLNGVTFSSNSASGNGGAVYVGDGDSLILSGSVFTGNTATSQGGAIHNGGGTVTISDGVFTGNTAADGAAISNLGTLTIEASDPECTTPTDPGAFPALTTFADGVATGDGGAINNVSGVLNIYQTRFTNNTAGNGGAIFEESGAGLVTVGCSVFDLNSASEGGAIAGQDDGDVHVVASLFHTNSATSGAGGAIADTVDGTRLEISETIFDSNTASGVGGAIASTSKLTDNSNSFIANTASQGGAIHADSPSDDGFSSTGSSFVSNNASTEGGALFLSVEEAEITGATMKANTGRSAGGIYTDFDLTISTSTFSDNQAIANDGVGGNGGAILQPYGDLAIANSTFDGNDSRFGGAIAAGGNLSVLGSTFSNNTTSGGEFDVSGGGLLGFGQAEVINSTFSGNQALTGNGGGMAVSGEGSIALNQVTVVENHADAGAGGGMYNSSGSLTIRNSLVAFNTATTQAECGNTTSLGYNLFRLLADCDSVSTDIGGVEAPLDPVIGPLVDNGGPTLTHALLGGSPAIDAADPGSVVIELNAAIADGHVQSQSSGPTPNPAGVLTNEPEAGSFFAGSVIDEPFDLTEGFSTSFSFLLDPVGPLGTDASGDGITFAIVDSQTFLGDAGGRLGIGTIGGNPSVAVEFDTYFNGFEGIDPDGNHVGIDIGGVSNGDAVASIATAAVPFALDPEPNEARWVWIDYIAASHILDVYVSSTSAKPSLPILSATVDISATVGETGYFGFTGSGDAAWANQSILSWELYQSTCETIDQRGAPRPEGPACDMGSVEIASIPPSLTNVTQTVDTNSTEPGVVEVPLLDIPIEKITGAGEVVESSPLASIPLASIPLASIDLSASPLASIPLASIPLASITIEGSPLASIPLASIPLASIGGWSAVLEGTTFAGLPLQTITLADLDSATLSAVSLADISIQGSPLASITLPSIALGSATMGQVDTTQDLCAVSELAGFDCQPATTTLLDLEVQGAPLASIPLASIPLASIDLASTPLASIPLASIPLASIPLASIPLASINVEGSPLASIPLASITAGSTPLASIDMLAAPLASIPLASIPLASIPLASIDIGDQSFCEYLAGVAPPNPCTVLGIDEATDGIADLITALATATPTGTIAGSPLASIPLASINIANVPLASIPLASIDLAGTPLASIPLASIDLGGTDFCEFLGDDPATGAAWCSTLGIDGSETLLDLAAALETVSSSISDTPLASIPLASIPLASIPLASIDLAATELAGTPLASIPLASINILHSPLASIPLASIPLASIGDVVSCDIVLECQTLGEAVEQGALVAGAALGDLAGAFGDITFGELVDALTLAFVLGNGTFGDTTELGNLTFGQLLMSLLLASDYPWEELDLYALGVQEFSPDNFVEYAVEFDLDGTAPPLSTTVTASIPGEFLYAQGTSVLDVGSAPQAALSDPEITIALDGSQTLIFDLGQIVAGDHFRLRYGVVPALRLGSFSATAGVAVTGLPAQAAESSASVTVIEAASMDADDPAAPSETLADILYLGNISGVDDIDYFQIPAPPKGYRVAVFLSNLNADADLVMYRPATAPLPNQRSVPLDGIPIEDDGVNYSFNATEEPDTLADINLLAAPLASISTNRGTTPEEASAISAADPFTIQVSGYNGATSDEPYVLRVKIAPEVPTPQCSPRSFPFPVPAGGPSAADLSDAALPADLNTVYLVNWERLAASEGVDPATGLLYADLILEELHGSPTDPTIPGLVDRPDLGLSGIVIPVEHIADYSAWDANPCDPDAANTIGDQISTVISTIAELRPSLRYLTIVGSDEVIPMIRKPDLTSIANESTFSSDFADNALYGSAVTRHYLSDDPYADLDPIPWLDRYLSVPELAIGRLVEGGDEIVGAIRTFNQFGGQLDPQTALTTGYDFLFDGSVAVDEALTAFVPTADALLDPVGVDPALAWGINELRVALGLDLASPDLPDIGSLNMHYDFDEALPSRGDAQSNTTSDLFDVTQIQGLNQLGGLYFTAGCHSGLSVADVAVGPGLPAQDWVQTYAENGAVSAGQTGYGYGDTVSVALTEKLMAQFARNLDGTLTIGQAMTFAKQAYFKDLGLYGVYDEKALQEATFYGLPMYSIGTTTPATPLPPLGTSIDPSTGLSVASIAVAPDIDQQTTVNGELFSVGGATQFVHHRPIQPIVRMDVTQPGFLAHGALLTSLATTDVTDVDIAYGRPIIDSSIIEPEVETDEIAFPTTFANISSFNAPPGPDSVGPVDERQQLNVIVGQFTSPADGSATGTERVFDTFEAEVFYTEPGETDFVQPRITLIQAALVGDHASFSVTTDDAGDPDGVKRVVALYRKSASGDPEQALWESVDLVQVGGTWTGGGPIGAGALVDGKLDYMIQAVDAAGNVGVSTFKGLFHDAEELPPPPTDGGPGPQVEIIGTQGQNGWYLDGASVTVVAVEGITYTFSLNGSPFAPVPGEGIVITREGVNIVVIKGSDGSMATFGVLVDTKDPIVIITSPVAGAIIEQGSGATAEYTCLDAGSGITECAGSIPDGDPIDGSTGAGELTVEASDNSGRSSTAAASYTVVAALELSGPTTPIALGTEAVLSAQISDTPAVETVSWDWESDGVVEESCSDASSATCSVSPSNDPNLLDVTGKHTYAAPGVYKVTVTVDYGGAYLQQATFESVVVYDAGGTFVTGGGWIDSLAEAYTPGDATDVSPSQAGMGNFSFVSKYKKNKVVPTGNLNFKVGDDGFRFRSLAHEWLVISSARARLEGVGLVDERPREFKFRLTVLDGDLSSTDPYPEDRFRIRIWTEEIDESGTTFEFVLYDNGYGFDDGVGDGGTSELGGGSIQIHDK